MRSCRGITLIELIITLSIIGVLILIAVPNIDSFFEVKLNACVQKMLFDIRYAQYLAIAEHETYAIEFDVGNNYYRVYDPATGDLIRDPYTGLNLSIDLDETSEYAGLTISAVDIDTADEVRFTSFGRPLNSSGGDLAATGSVTVSYGGNSRTIVVYPVTGWVEIQ